MSVRFIILIGAAIVLGLVVAACNAPAPTPTPMPVPTYTTQPTPLVDTGADAAALGAPVFLQHCSPCHGVLGQGVSAPALRNNQFVQTAGDQAVALVIQNGLPRTRMPAWLQSNGGALTNIQIGEVVAYLHTLQKVEAVPSATPAPPEPTETPAPAGGPTPEPAKPSNEGGPGPAAAIRGNVEQGKADFGLFCAICHGPEGVRGDPNPDSDDGVVPPLNPIDPTLVNADPKVFAQNLDLYIEHGSLPAGENPLLLMPPFGDSKMLTDQQIADLITYVMSLNGVNR